MDTKKAYKFTGFVILIVGVLFFLRDIGVNFIGNISGWTIIIVLVGAGLVAGESMIKVPRAPEAKAKAKVKAKGKL